MSVQERILLAGALVFVTGIVLVATLDSWWAIVVEIVGGVLALTGAMGRP